MAAALAFVLAGAAACGSTRAPGGAGGPGTPVPTGPATGSVESPADAVPLPGRAEVTALPARPASDDFRERADALGTQLRSTGTLETYRTRLALFEPRVIETGYESSELKILFGYGGFVAGPEIPDAVGTGTITLEDGSTRTVQTIGARTAIEVATTGAPGCDAVEEAVEVACPATMTRAEKGTYDLRTNRGRATVPVWKFWAEGLKTPYVVVAVSESDLASQLPPQGDRVLQNLPEVDGLLGAMQQESVEGRSLTVGVGHGACDRDVAGHVVELDDMVVVGGTTSGFEGVACTAQLLTSPVVFQLGRPLGDRPVIDIGSGNPLPGPWIPGS